MTVLTFNAIAKVAANVEFVSVPTFDGAKIRVEVCEDVYIYREYDACFPWIVEHYNDIMKYGVLYDKDRSFKSCYQYNEYDNDKYYRLCNYDIDVVNHINFINESDVVMEAIDRALFIFDTFGVTEWSKGKAVEAVEFVTCDNTTLITCGYHWRGLYLETWQKAFLVTRDATVNDYFWQSSFMEHCPEELLSVAWDNRWKLKKLLPKFIYINWAAPENKINSIYELIFVLKKCVELEFEITPVLPSFKRYKEYKALWLKKYKRLPKKETLLWNLSMVYGWNGEWDFKVPYEPFIKKPYTYCPVFCACKIMGNIIPRYEEVFDCNYFDNEVSYVHIPYVRWIMKGHKMLPSNVNVSEIPDETFTNDTSYNKIVEYYEKALADIEYQKIQDKYGSLSDIDTIIPSCEVQDGIYKASTLSMKDKIWTRLGYITHCCQHLDGAGESAMMYGALSEHGGFWTVSKKGSIIAQAELWQDVNGALVFDNIELSNNRDMSEITDIVYRWCKKSQYDTIYLGLGYTDISVEGYPKAPTPNQIYCERLGRLAYTDARECVYLKKGGVTYEASK